MNLFVLICNMAEPPPAFGPWSSNWIWLPLPQLSAWRRVLQVCILNLLFMLVSTFIPDPGLGRKRLRCYSQWRRSVESGNLGAPLSEKYHLASLNKSKICNVVRSCHWAVNLSRAGSSLPCSLRCSPSF